MIIIKVKIMSNFKGKVEPVIGTVPIEILQKCLVKF